MVGENILDVFLAVPTVVGEHIFGVFLAAPRVGSPRSDLASLGPRFARRRRTLLMTFGRTGFKIFLFQGKLSNCEPLWGD